MRYVSWCDDRDEWYEMDSVVNITPLPTFADLAGRKDSDSFYADAVRAEKNKKRKKKRQKTKG